VTSPKYKKGDKVRHVVSNEKAVIIGYNKHIEKGDDGENYLVWSGQYTVSTGFGQTSSVFEGEIELRSEDD